MINRIVLLAVMLISACDPAVTYRYRVHSEDPNVNPERILAIVNTAVLLYDNRTQGSLDPGTGDVVFGLTQIGFGRSLGVRQTEAHVRESLRSEFSNRVTMTRDGNPVP